MESHLEEGRSAINRADATDADNVHNRTSALLIVSLFTANTRISPRTPITVENFYPDWHKGPMHSLGIVYICAIVGDRPALVTGDEDEVGGIQWVPLAKLADGEEYTSRSLMALRQSYLRRLDSSLPPEAGLPAPGDGDDEPSLRVEQVESQTEEKEVESS